jgi:hypothetical protein
VQVKDGFNEVCRLFLTVDFFFTVSSYGKDALEERCPKVQKMARLSMRKRSLLAAFLLAVVH